MLKFFLAILVLAFAIVLPEASGQTKTVPEALTQYVRDARKAGLDETHIQQKAVTAGWPAADVASALAATAPAKAKPEPAPNAATTPTPTWNPPGTPAASPAATTRSASEQAAPPVAGGTVPPAAGGTVSPAAGGATPPASDEAAGTKTPPVINRGVADDYRIGEGDVLGISVWGERDASVPSVVVRHDGKISMPLVKEIAVAGLTPPEAEKLITEQLSKMLKAPDVTIMVSQINSKKIFMIGAVKKEGPMQFAYRMTVMQAISEAGGLTDYAKKKKIYVLHTDNGREFKLPFNYEAVLKGEHMEQNIALQPGDTVVVPH
jgi:polysaccharide export outer membrane protein